MAAEQGLAGRLAAAFQRNAITPLIALVLMLAGVFATLVTPREEEPQIDVTMANVIVPFPGASARDVEALVARPAEQVLSRMAGVEHVYSVSRPGMAVITVQFEVGVPNQTALVRLYDTVHSNRDWLSPQLGVGEPVVKPKGIDDVPILALTLWSADDTRAAYEMQQVSRALELELKRLPGTRDVQTLGGPDRVVKVDMDVARMNAHGISAQDLRGALQLANASQPAGSMVADNREVLVQTGAFIESAEDVRQLVVGVSGGRPVYLRDVAEVGDGPDQPSRYVWFGSGAAAAAKGIDGAGRFPAVTLALSKKPGANAADVAAAALARVEALRGSLIPDGVQLTVTRNYGETANDKAQKLIGKLVFATAAVVALVFFALGWREALIVGIAVSLTLAATLFASWAWGFTLNRVSLFALIFSIGILVDDAIVVVENIHRWHTLEPDTPLWRLIPRAVDEVGGPTILATFTVIAALLPMAFVTGLMGPYMSPIPINASMGMFISLVVAFVVTPWLAQRLLKSAEAGHHPGDDALTRRLDGMFRRVMTPMLDATHGARARARLWLAVLVLIAVSLALPAMQWVVLKMLPFDNKSEFQVVLDMPVGTPVEETARVLGEIGEHLGTVAEVTDWQAYAGTAAPINFNGLVRQYYLRSSPELGDIQVNLTDKAQRTRKSHEIAVSVREAVAAIARRNGGNAKVVEVPPGPPVLSPIVAEIYGPDYAGQAEVAARVRAVFERTADIVGVDDTVDEAAPKLLLRVDQAKAARLGVAQADIVDVLRLGLAGENVTPLHGGDNKYEVPVRVQLPARHQSDIGNLLAMKVRARGAESGGRLVAVGELVTVQETRREQVIYRKDLLPVVYVTGDMGGRLDSPLYGMFGIRVEVKDMALGGAPGLAGTLDEWFIRPPADAWSGYSLKWDGEWQVTYETFRDMGAAYAVGLVLIYLLVVAQFRSYLVPLIIMAPIPLTLIGVMPGHALLGAQFTATSMIGMIALAGIIVRNSILLVDFINQQLAEGSDFGEAVIRAAAVRAKPIGLTALAAMIGAVFILDDPIFNGLAISLIFGVFISTVLTLVVIPMLYFAAMRRRAGALNSQPQGETA
ncbi:efflux RND transporter permease subunit [Azoarcus olearius]|uniref:RND efflux transporter, permease protein n=1 Tax=Azoarcus sp. (strain BH72) TaxID=418699 RepID=A1KAY5_AZOSB|nr:efflux RND transporter permease subunit [Azoarcus olearius]CAL95991.1 RND efflux transporter, permease protein [Azoarcus olearius]